MLVSVILTTYNSAASIRRTLDSIINQEGCGTAFDLEIIVVDDQSIDETWNILGEYSDIIKLQNSQNSGGPNKGRNLGLEHAKGQAICIADHDDEWMPDRLARQLPLLEIAPISSGGYIVIDDETSKRQERVKSCPSTYEQFAGNQTFISRLSRHAGGQTTYLGTLLFSSNLKGIRFEELYGAIDYDWILRLFENQSSVELCEALYYRHVYGANLSLNERYRLKDHQYSLFFIERYRAQFPKAVAQGERRINGSLARFYYLVDKMPEARRYFLKAGVNVKTLSYWLTTWAGSSYVKRKFNVFG